MLRWRVTLGNDFGSGQVWWVFKLLVPQREPLKTLHTKQLWLVEVGSHRPLYSMSLLPEFLWGMPDFTRNSTFLCTGNPHLGSCRNPRNSTFKAGGGCSPRASVRLVLCIIPVPQPPNAVGISLCMQNLTLSPRSPLDPFGPGCPGDPGKP